MAAQSGIPNTTPLEPFDPPSGYRFEPELQETPPRHVPEEFRNSPYFARQRNTMVGLLVAGALCAACGQLPIFREWGLYVLPLFGMHGFLMTLVIGFGAIMLGGAVVLCWCLTANALLDKSKPELRPVEIVEFWSTTHSFLLREYEIEYRFPGESKTRKLFSTPAQMHEFRSREGMAEVHAGRFGWSWVKTLAPAE